jgi:hypothetical protein
VEDLHWRLDGTKDPRESTLTHAFLLIEPDPNSPRILPQSLLTPPSDAELRDLGDNDVEADDSTITVTPSLRSRIPVELLPPPPPNTRVGAGIRRKSGRRFAVSYYRRHKVVELRMAGTPFRDIARALQFNSVESARYAYRRALEDTHEASEDLRLLELERLDHLTSIIWPQIEMGDLEALNTYLKISAVRARVAGFERAPLVNPGNRVVIEGIEDEQESHAVAMLENVQEFLALLPGLADRLMQQASTKMIEGTLLEATPIPNSNGHGPNGSNGSR